MSRKASPQTLNIRWGSSEESQQAIEFISRLDGVADISAVQVGAFAMLYARHISKVRPVLTGATQALTKSGRPLIELFKEIDTADLSGLTTTSRSFMKTTSRVMLLGSNSDVRRAVDNAVSVLLGEFYRRQALSNDLVEEDDSTLEDASTDDVELKTKRPDESVESVESVIAATPETSLDPESQAEEAASEEVVVQSESSSVNDAGSNGAGDVEQEIERVVKVDLSEDDVQPLTLDAAIEDDVVIVSTGVSEPVSSPVGSVVQPDSQVEAQNDQSVQTSEAPARKFRFGQKK